jgi:hypothetical protein
MEYSDGNFTRERRNETPWVEVNPRNHHRSSQRAHTKEGGNEKEDLAMIHDEDVVNGRYMLYEEAYQAG